MAELSRTVKTGQKIESATPSLPKDIALPLQTYQQVENVERKLRIDFAAKRQMVIV